ncbi:CIA30 family protein [Ekhidna sp.]|uniref:CIA30 family protein n=1 Tax=Ekhidna sp. TaxID=2608089 RepID=UPI003BA9403D
MIDFTSLENDDWYIINDGVMGGLSKGKTTKTDDGVTFYGSVSLENNGGFTSFRAPWDEYDLTNYKEVTIRYRSEGMRLAFVMETSQRFWIPNYKVGLSNSEEWITETFQLEDFKQYRLGDPTGKSFSDEVKDEIIRVGFITNEKRAGDFKFEVAMVEFN